MDDQLNKAHLISMNCPENPAFQIRFPAIQRSGAGLPTARCRTLSLKSNRLVKAHKHTAARVTSVAVISNGAYGGANSNIGALAGKPVMEGKAFSV